MTTNSHNEEEKIEFEMSSGNVFADLGFEQPQEMLLKSELVRQINSIIQTQGSDGDQTKEVLDIDENIRSNLSKGKLTELTIEQLLRYLNILGKDLEIVLKPATIPHNFPKEKLGQRGNLKVTAV